MDTITIKVDPSGKGDFTTINDALDFEGNALDPEVVRLMTILEEEMKYFKFLGNYKHFD